MHQRLKKIIFDKLTEDLSKVEIILSENQSIWFIDRANKYWYFELEKSGKLWWRYEFFTDFFILFCLKSDEFQPLLSEWVEGVLNYGVNTTIDGSCLQFFKVEGVLNCGVNTTDYEMGQATGMVEGVLNRGVNTTSISQRHAPIPVEGVLNRGVNTTPMQHACEWVNVGRVLNSAVNTTDGALTVSDNMVEGILNREVNTAMPKNNRSIGVEGIFDSNINMTPRSGHRLHTTVEGILNHGYRKGSRKVDEVLNIGVNTTEYCGIIPSCDLEKVLNREINEIDGGELFENDKVEDILNRDTNSTAIVGTVPPLLMEGETNYKVNTTCSALSPPRATVERVLNRKINSTDLLGSLTHMEVERVLNRGINETKGTTILDTSYLNETLSREVHSISYASEKNEFVQQIMVNELIYKIESATPLYTEASDSVDEILNNTQPLNRE